MIGLVVVVVLVVVAVAAAAILRRTGSDPPAQGPSWRVFSSATCLACHGTWEKARLLESDEVAVQELEAIAHKDVHDRYGVDAVPLVLVADADGAVRRHFVGPPTATDLWAALADLREPGTVPPSCTDTGDATA